MESQNRFYEFRQNNSGGMWNGPRFVFVQAVSASEADKVAQEHGVYFDGVRSGRDCECCGSRWSRALEWLRYNKEPATRWHYKVVYADGTVKVFNEDVLRSLR